MEKRPLSKITAVTFSAMMGLAMMTGCGMKTVSDVEIPDESVALEAAPEEATVEAEKAPEVDFFIKGVYANYAAELDNPEKTNFFVFTGEGIGYVEDGAANTGNSFSYEQYDGKVVFHFGNQDPYDDTLTVSSFASGIVIGYFEDDVETVFELMPDIDPGTFDAVNYVNSLHHRDVLYTDANGWSIKYNPDRFVVNQGGPMTTIVYTGDCAGTCMITATYTAGGSAEEAVKAIGEEYGDRAYYSQGPFPGTDDVEGYWVTISPDSDNYGSGAFKTVIARDYMEGVLVFEMDEHMGQDEEQNMEVSDNMAAIIDSLQFAK